jgi:hypothetical protein
MRRNWGHFLHGKKNPSCTQNRALPTHHRTPDSPRWRSRLALGVGEGQKLTGCIDSPVRRRGDVKQMRRNWGHFLHGKKNPSCTQNRALPTNRRSPDNPRWRSRLALDVGEGQKPTRCIDSHVRRRGGVKQMRRNWGNFLDEKKHPSCTQNRAVPTHQRTPDAPRWRSRLALDVGEGQKPTGCIDSPVRRRGDVK